ncbi:MAG: serine hydrolase [Flavobacterium sp.]|nr:serine hydrolase [Flavobacterium sp.]
MQNNSPIPGYSYQNYSKACKNSKEIFTVFPQKFGYTYTWTVIGGTITSATGNPKEITWGNTDEGKIMVVISNDDGTCKQTIKETICLVDAPVAGFSFAPNTSICANELIQFTDSSKDASTWNWDFGDGTISTAINPNHSYAAAGTYIITLTVTNDVYSQNTGIDRPCSCSDTVSKTITIGSEGITIIPDCKQMLCKGDKATYSTANPCSSYNWSVTGGSIVGTNNAETVEVLWDGSYPSLVSMTGTCSNSCGNSGSLTVPVLYPTLPISGLTTVCPFDSSTYSLPYNMPGTNYTWTISGAGTISGFNKDTSNIIVNAVAASTTSTQAFYTITCNYAHPITKCNGTATLKVMVLPHFKISDSPENCVDGTFSYTSNGNANWTISPTSGTALNTFSNVSTISGTWTNAGVYTIKATPVTPTDFCSSPDSTVTTVLPKPVLTAIVGPVIICPSLPYVYTVSSNRAGGTFVWTVVGGTSVSSGSNQNTATVTWNNSGTYSLSVSQTGLSCTAPNYQTITVNKYPIPIITGSNTSCMDTELIYTCNDSGNPGDYVWTVSNALGSIISGQGTNTVHVMWHGSTNPPPNTCNLILTTCSGTVTKTVTIIAPPVIVITKTGTLCATTGINLSSNITGATYIWDLNGVVKPTLNTQTITVLEAGIYTLRITGASGCVSVGSIVIPKEPTGFTAHIATTDKTYWFCDETVSTTFNVTTSTGYTTYCYQWFRGGLSTPGIGDAPIPGATTASYTATQAGLYYWCEVRVCNTGCLELTDRILIVKDVCGGIPCTIDNYTPDYTISIVCNPFTFTSLPNPAGTPYWMFGDGKDGSGSPISHQYKGIGTYKVCAIFGNGICCRKRICKTVMVNLANNFTANVVCDKVTFNNLCQVQSPATITNYNWQFVGGSPASSSLANPLPVTYAVGGTHTASLEITGSDGCKIEYSVNFTTTAIPISMNIPSQICLGSIIPFTVPGSDPDISFSWEFGDGYISNLQNTEHIYGTIGSKTVTLTVTAKNGCNTKLTKVINVIGSVTASIGIDKKLCSGDKVTLSTTTSFATFQWYKDNVLIIGATNATYDATAVGTYYVLAGSDTGGGCTTFSNKIKVTLYPVPFAQINGERNQCTANLISLNSVANMTGDVFSWTSTGPAPLVFTNTQYINATATVAGEYNVTLNITSKDGCKAKTTICIMVVESPTITVTAPTTPMCEGTKYTFTAVGTSNTNPTDYVIKWSNGIIGNTMSTGAAGTYSATITNAGGCTATAIAGTIMSLPDISLFPKGCQKACWTDTINFPLPSPLPSGNTYTITWFDDDGTTVTNVGTGASLPLSTLQPGIHHFHATVSISGGCVATTGVLDLNIKDCTLLPECENCKDLLSKSSASADKNITSSNNAQISNETITFTILKPVKEVRISLADIKYFWKDPACANCKIQMIERGCLFAASNNQALSTLVPEPATATNSVNLSAVNNCSNELIWKNGTVLQPGTYTIPLQLSLPKPLKKDCILVLEKACFQLTLIDVNCKKCETVFCKKDKIANPNECACNDGNNWSNLFLTSNKPGKPKIKNQIICGDTMTDIDANAPYTLSGVYNCKGKCPSIKNEITVYNQVNDIIYTHQSAALIENFSFPEAGNYSVSLTATCGDKKCVCNFRITVKSDHSDDPLDNPDTDEIVKTDDPKKPEDPKKPIEDIIKEVLPPDFNGGILVSKNDDILFEKYYSFKDNVTSHTAFDLASVTKTFTAMAILKLMEDGKLSVDDAVSKYLSGFPIPEITIKMLLSHKSGLEDYLKFIDESDWDKKKNLINDDLLQFIIKNKSKVLINVPGKTFDYSNTNFALLALIIEKTSCQQYKEYLSNTFFKPLQMTDTYMLNLDNYAKATKSYYKNGKTYSLRYLDLVYGDKNIYSTIQDLRKWDKALRNGKMFKKTTLDLAYAPTSKLTPFESNYGLGWKKITTTSGKEVIYHTGWWAGSRSLLMRLPAENVMIAVTSNNNFSNIADIKKLCDLFGDYQLTGRKIDNF